MSGWNALAKARYTRRASSRDAKDGMPSVARADSNEATTSGLASLPDAMTFHVFRTLSDRAFASTVTSHRRVPVVSLPRARVALVPVAFRLPRKPISPSGRAAPSWELPPRRAADIGSLDDRPLGPHTDARMTGGRVGAMPGRARASPRAATLATVLLALAVALPSAHAAPRLFAAPERSNDGSLCATATENRHEIADSKGAVCSPLALDQTTGCCLEPKTEVTARTCSDDCSERECCESFARCVACCHRSVRELSESDANAELEPVSYMHPAMWRRWLIQHATRHGGHGRETVRGESHPFPPGQDDYRVQPFEYCALRCRSNSRSTRYENEYQHAKHHCFGVAGAETLGAEDTLSPGREKLHDEAGDFKLERGVSVSLGLAKTIPRPSDGGAASGAASGETNPIRAFFHPAGGRRTKSDESDFVAPEAVSSSSSRPFDETSASFFWRALEVGGVLAAGAAAAARQRRRRANERARGGRTEGRRSATR